MIRTPAPRAPALRIATPGVAIHNTVRERWQNRLMVLAYLVWSARSIAKSDLGRTLDGADVFLTVFMGLALAALSIGRSHGAPIAGIRLHGQPGTVVLDDDLEVEIAGRRRRFPRDAIASGWTERFADGNDDVVLQMRDGAVVRWRALGADEARAALHAAGVALEHRAVTLRLGVAQAEAGRAGLILLSFLVALIGLVAAATGVVLTLTSSPAERPVGVAIVAVAVVFTGILLGKLLGPLVTSTVRIGTDGIAITRLFRRRFIPRASFRSVDVYGNMIAITALDGEGARLPVSSDSEAGVVARRIEEAMAERDGAGHAAQARLDRGGRPIAAWLREVRALARGTSGYRDVKLDREVMCAVVEDGAAPGEQRIAAAAALAGDEEGKARARIAAQACADERLRIAIEEATEDEIDEARIDEALRATVGNRRA